jgi:hypothetical protein
MSAILFRLWPRDERSGGMRAIYHLVHLLQHGGYDVRIGERPRPFEVVVDPDNMPGNVTHAARVVRYMCYFAGAAGHGYNDGHRIPAGQCVILYHEDYRAEVSTFCDGPMPPDNVVTVPSIETGLFYPEAKAVDKLLYVGKAHTPFHPSWWRGVAVVTKDNMDRKAFATMLRRARNLYSLDHHTVVVYEAALAGCQPWYVYEDRAEPGITSREPGSR